MKIYGHRGASAHVPENTLAAFSAARDASAYGIELDLHATRDGVPVVIHDRSLARTSGPDRNVDELSLEDLRTIAPSVPTLQDVASLVGDTVHLDLEIKQAGIERAVLSVLDQAPSVRWAVSSFEWDVIRSMRALRPDAELWLLGMQWDDSMLVAARETAATTAALHDPMVSEAVVRSVHAAGLDVMVWTVNDPDRASRLAEWGVRAICTDDPAAMAHLARSGQ